VRKGGNREINNNNNNNTLHVAQTVNTEQLQHCIPYRQGLFGCLGYIIVHTVRNGGNRDSGSSSSSSSSSSNSNKIKELQTTTKTAILDTAHKLREVLM